MNGGINRVFCAPDGRCVAGAAWMAVWPSVFLSFAHVLAFFPPRVEVCVKEERCSVTFLFKPLSFW